MKLEDVLEHFGGKAETARACGISYQAVDDWERRYVIPPGRQYQIEVLTEGALKAAPNKGDTAA